jgi:hypothetical protein
LYPAWVHTFFQLNPFQSNRHPTDNLQTTDHGNKNKHKNENWMKKKNAAKIDVYKRRCFSWKNIVHLF